VGGGNSQESFKAKTLEIFKKKTPKGQPKRENTVSVSINDQL